MKRSMVTIGCFMLLGMVGLGCGSAESENSTAASLASDQSKLCSSAKPHVAGEFVYEYLHAYRSFTRDEILENTDFGVEITEEARKSFDPLNGTGLDKRKTCSRAFRKQGETKVYLEANRVPGSHLVQSARAEKNYLVLQGQTAASTIEIVLLNTVSGLRKVLATEPSPRGGCNASLGAYPSPNGAHVAVIRLFSKCGTEQPSSEDVTLRLFNAAGDLVGSPYSGTFTPGVNVYWLSESSYELKDDRGSVPFEVPSV